jgi:hypothetical protein
MSHLTLKSVNPVTAPARARRLPAEAVVPLEGDPKQLKLSCKPGAKFRARGGILILRGTKSRLGSPFACLSGAGRMTA